MVIIKAITNNSDFTWKDYEILDLSIHFRSNRITEVSSLWKLIVPKWKITWYLHSVTFSRDKIVWFFKLLFSDALYTRIYLILLLCHSSSMVNRNAFQAVLKKSFLIHPLNNAFLSSHFLPSPSVRSIRQSLLLSWSTGYDAGIHNSWSFCSIWCIWSLE